MPATAARSFFSCVPPRNHDDENKNQRNPPVTLVFDKHIYQWLQSNRIADHCQDEEGK
jgi:hypothetical protein